MVAQPAFRSPRRAAASLATSAALSAVAAVRKLGRHPLVTCGWRFDDVQQPRPGSLPQRDYSGAGGLAVFQANAFAAPLLERL